MIRLETIYEKTNKGLDIIHHWCPASMGAEEDVHKTFCYRASERVPSAFLLPPSSPHNKSDYWKLKDFGMEGFALSPMDIVMEECNCSFYEALVRVATKFNITDDADRAVCKPRIEKRTVTAKELAKDPSVEWFRYRSGIEKVFLSLWAPYVEAQHLEELGWHAAEFTRSVNKNGELVTRYATENYPIFIRECRSSDKPTFYKVYEPRNLQKHLRFAVIGEHVENYINGLFELEQAFNDYRHSQKNDEEEDEKDSKLPRAVICSGERDAVCCYSRGEHPIWFNSETDTITGAKISSVMKYVRELYNIPDIDNTGRQQGIKLALRFISVKTVWLPESLLQFRDDRGGRRKDLRDWIEMNPRQEDFKHLLTRALQAKFWDENPSARARSKYVINSVRLNYFLSLNGYYCLDEEGEEPRLIHVDGNVVEQVWARDIRRFVYEWAHDSRQDVSMEVLETIQTSMRMKGNTLECIPMFSPDFTDCTEDSQGYVFSNGTVQVTADGISLHSKAVKTDTYVWKKSIIGHDFCMFNTEQWLGERYPQKEVLQQLHAKGKQVQPMAFFSTSFVDNLYDVVVLEPERSPFFSFVINSSRVHWRKEMELRFEGDLTAMAEYRRTHRFCIDGEGLSAAEIAEQKQNLLNKLFVIGYLAHHFKSPNRAWAVVAMDNLIDSKGRCNGRSGKSFFCKAISYLCNTVELRGRDRRLLDNPHFLEEVTDETRVVNVEDCGAHFKVGPFYSLITSDMQINRKMVSSVTIPFARSPKFYFSTNYVLSEEDVSTSARVLPVVFSDYYHMRSQDSSYLEDRDIASDIGMQLMYASYPEECWQADFMFMMQCLRFYLSVVKTDMKLMPPMGNIYKRSTIQNMDPKFKTWLRRFLFVENNHLNARIDRAEAYDSYCRFIGTDEPITKVQFKKSFKDFCDMEERIVAFNPDAECTDHARGRIMVNNVEYFFVEAKDEEDEDQAFVMGDDMDDDGGDYP